MLQLGKFIWALQSLLRWRLLRQLLRQPSGRAPWLEHSVRQLGRESRRSGYGVAFGHTSGPCWMLGRASAHAWGMNKYGCGH